MQRVRISVLGVFLVAAASPNGPAWAGTSRDDQHGRLAGRQDSVVLQWNEVTLEAIRRSTLGPPMVARALAIAHTCMYDAWAAYDRVAHGTRLGGALRQPPRERQARHNRAALSVAAYRALVDLFPAQRALFDDLMARLGYVLQISARLTDRQKMISEYWADGPASELPPGHWNLLAQVVARRDRHSVDEDVKLFFLLNNALFDASVAVWDCKRFYDYVRPITAIRFLFAGQRVEAWGGPSRGTRTIDGKDWLPYQRGTFLTPPFAEYVSGHSTFSAASAEILKRFTGSDVFRSESRWRQARRASSLGLLPAIGSSCSGRLSRRQPTRPACLAGMAAFTSVTATSRAARWEDASRRSSGRKRSACLRTRAHVIPAETTRTRISEVKP